MEKKHLKVIEKQEIKDKLKRGEAPYKQKSKFIKLLKFGLTYFIF